MEIPAAITTKSKTITSANYLQPPSENKSLPPRPGSSYGPSSKFNKDLVRPSTSAGSRTSTQDFFSYNSPNNLKNSNSVIDKQITNDSLLKILSNGEKARINDAIMYAETGNFSAIKKLIDIGSSIFDIRGMDGYSLLHHACNRGHAAVVSELLKSYFPINLKNESGETPLHLAVYSGNLLIVEQLLDRGADIDATNNYNETPLFYAARRSYPALVRLLLMRGADIDAIDQDGETAQDHIKTNDQHTLKAFQIKSNIETNYNKNSFLPLSELFHVCSYLTSKELCRISCVSGKCHRVSESEVLWNKLGVRRWELALQSSLGFSMTPASSFRMRKPSKDKIQLK